MKMLFESNLIRWHAASVESLPASRRSNHTRQEIERYYYGNPVKVADRILLIKRCNRLAEYRQRLTNLHEFGQVWQGLTGTLRGKQLTIIATGIGPSLVGDAVYALNRPNSICLYSGTCGGLETGLQIGDYFVADRAICGDGYSLHFGYAPLTEISGDTDLLNSLIAALHRKTGRVQRGTSFTTSSVVRETDADFWQAVDTTCQAIEMSGAAFYAAAAATQKKAASYFWVSDLPTRKKSFLDELEAEDIQNKQKRYDQAADFDLDLLVAL